MKRQDATSLIERLFLSQAVDAQTWEAQGNEWNPDLHFIVPTLVPDDLPAVESIVQQYAAHIVAHGVSGLPGILNISLQFGETADDRKAMFACRRDYQNWCSRPKQRGKAAKRLATRRMYILPDGREFFYFGKWDNNGHLWGKVQSPTASVLENAIVKRSDLEQATLVPKDEERWLPETVQRP